MEQHQYKLVKAFQNLKGYVQMFSTEFASVSTNFS